MANEQLLFDAATPGSLIAVGVSYTLLLMAGTVAAIVLVWNSIRAPIDWTSRIHWLNARPWTWREGLSIVAIIGARLGIGMGAATLLKQPQESTLVILQSLLLDVGGIAAIAILLHRRDWQWTDAFGMGASPARYFRPGLLLYLSLLPFLLFSSLVYQGILSANGYPPSLQEISLLLSADHPLWLRCYLTLLAIVVAPIFEECLFRGIMLPLLVRRCGLGAGIFLTSLVFASIHFHFPSLIPLLVVATGFSLAYLYSRSLWVPIFMHGLFNGVNLALLLAMRH